MTLFNVSVIGTVSTQTLDAPTVQTLLLVSADTEYSAVLPAGTKYFSFQNRDDGLLKYRSTSGGPYWTVFPGQPHPIYNIKGTATITLYLESPKSGQTVEILSWA